jgi:polar amino acid transport system substrate-binding protein
MRRRSIVAAIVATSALLLAACGDDEADDASSTSGAAATSAAPATTAAGATDPAACAQGATIEEGVLTVATGEPAFPPYVIDDAPESGEGFEAAVAYAVADQMGFAPDAVTWTRSGFDEVIAPGPKTFDFNLQQFSITDERAQVVSFSEPYYTANQAILGIADSPAATATSIADLQGLKLGAATGTTSLSFITDVIQPDADPFVYNDNAAAKQALDAKQIDAIVADLPTALFITAVEMEGTTVYGQFPVAPGTEGDNFGMLFEKDNPLVACVDAALAALRDSGELEAIQTQWMSEYTEAPVISLG